ncbi:hypothetical protein [Aequorivita echinoideorum]|uniref:Uncharacterized protein n=1 Tax=Aequorivita echinoideorum TaxID=1549647 RepID=A0ABS5S7N2_9FLAO|nr:hypothetical protein [Aequorivita echinoideorum]MBT0609218.1 hypothetical protein [Aequorivita echinoideorum]
MGDRFATAHTQDVAHHLVEKSGVPKKETDRTRERRAEKKGISVRTGAAAEVIREKKILPSSAETDPTKKNGGSEQFRSGAEEKRCATLRIRNGSLGKVRE